MPIRPVVTVVTLRSRSRFSSIGNLPFQLAPGLVIDPILVAVVLYRARLAHRWSAILLAIGTVPLFVAPSGGVLAALLHLPICIAIAGLGLELWRLNAADSQDSPTLLRREAHAAQA